MKLSLRPFVFPLCRDELPASGLERLLISTRFQSVEMLLGLLILGPGLHHCHRCCIEIFSWNRALIEEILAAIEELLLGIEIFFCCLRV